MWLERNPPDEIAKKLHVQVQRQILKFLGALKAPSINKKDRSENEVVKSEQEESHYRSVETKFTCVQNVKSGKIYRRDIPKNRSQIRKNSGNHTWQRRLLVRGRRPPLQNQQC